MITASSPSRRACLPFAWLLVALAAGCTSSVQQTGTGGGGAGTGGGGTAGGGTGGCVPGTLVECYSGPPGTKDVGTCHAGAMECGADGLSFGPCQWEVTPKPEDCTTPEDEDCDGATPACPGKAVWSESFGVGDNEFVQCVALDPKGDIIVAGSFDGALTLGGNTLATVGQYDAFVAKLDATGKPVWVKSFGSTGNDYPVDVAVDAQGNILITGSVGGNVDFGDGPLAGFGGNDIFLIKLDPSGNLLWRKMFGSAQDDIGYGVAVDAAGNVFTIGEFDGTVDFGTGSQTAAAGDIYVARYGPDGAPAWVKKFGGQYEDFGSGIGVDSTGNVLITGGFHGPVDFGTGPLTTTGTYDGFVAKLDPTGKAIWVKQMKGGSGAKSFPVSYALAVDTHGAAVVSGYFWGNVDLGGGTLVSAGGTDSFVAKYDGNGNHVFSQRYGGSYVNTSQPTYPTEAAYSVAVDGADNVLLTGVYTDSPDLGGGALPKSFYGDAFVVKLDPSGKHLFSKGVGSAASYSNGSGVAVDAAGNAVVGGYFTGTIDFGAGPLTSQTTQDADIFVAKIAP